MAGETRQQRMVLETARHRITGTVTLPAEGHLARLSDFLNREGLAFISVVDAELSSHGSDRFERFPFIAVARDHVQLAFEVD